MQRALHIRSLHSGAVANTSSRRHTIAASDSTLAASDLGQRSSVVNAGRGQFSAASTSENNTGASAAQAVEKTLDMNEVTGATSI